MTYAHVVHSRQWSNYNTTFPDGNHRTLCTRWSPRFYFG